MNPFFHHNPAADLPPPFAKGDTLTLRTGEPICVQRITPLPHRDNLRRPLYQVFCYRQNNPRLPSATIVWPREAWMLKEHADVPRA